MTCPGGSGRSASSGNIAVTFEISEHSAGTVRAIGQLFPRPCVLPSQYQWISTEALLQYSVEISALPAGVHDVHDADNLYIEAECTAVTELYSINPTARRTETRTAHEFFRLNRGVSAIRDPQNSFARYRDWCDIALRVQGALRLAIGCPASGALTLPGFVSYGGVIKSSEGETSPVRALYDDQIVYFSEVAGFRGDFSWEGHPSHCLAGERASARSLLSVDEEDLVEKEKGRKGVPAVPPGSTPIRGASLAEVKCGFRKFWHCFSGYYGTVLRG